MWRAALKQLGFSEVDPMSLPTPNTSLSPNSIDPNLRPRPRLRLPRLPQQEPKPEEEALPSSLKLVPTAIQAIPPLTNQALPLLPLLLPQTLLVTATATVAVAETGKKCQ